MAKRMLVHDNRLKGKAPRIAQNIYVVDSSTPTSHIIAWVGEHARRQHGLDDLIIMCHGYAMMEDERAQMTKSEPVGSQGLQLGAPGLSCRNASKTAEWNPNITNIYVYACGASVQSNVGNPEFDGSRFCGELAIFSGANVYASDRLQWYSRVMQNLNWFQRLTGTGQPDTIDFGSWEGTVSCYSPVDGRGTPVVLGPQPI